ncbi:hypothetical protein AJ78_06874 [Emergomyces pasteurianus Ep9510]|uniref:IBR domain-containing protein n=1 Tax=Emergomyces pasteurianus Ep9510 TaxID=1447872 RepID=A0A1J9PXE2_9EURO|nr:hypothetical protein AJ78_06874 [Emergomyces pasteurianus Ep9510]
MKLSLVSAGLFVVGSVLAQPTPGGSGLGDIMRRMRLDDEGLVDAGPDGILRSFDKRGRVIDFARLDHRQLMYTARALPNNNGLAKRWQNVNSSEVDEETIWSPPKHLLPRRFTDLEAVDEQRSPAAPLHHNSIRASRQCRSTYCQVTLQCRAIGCYFCLNPPPGHGESHCMDWN